MIIKCLEIPDWLTFSVQFSCRAAVRVTLEMALWDRKSGAGYPELEHAARKHFRRESGLQVKS